MGTYMIKINEKSKKAKTFIKFLMDYAQNNDDISVEREHIPNAVTHKAIEDARKGKVESIDDLDDFFKTI
jgi:hypothetical protein